MTAATPTTGATTFVLAHGAWHRPGAWDRVATLLEARGHRVVSPDLDARTLAGSVDRLAKAVERLDETRGDVTLVAHSWAGIPATQVIAAGAPVVRLVLLDGWIAQGGESLFDVAPDWFEVWSRSTTDDRGDVAVPPPAAFGVDPESDDAGWLAEHLRPQPLATFTDAAVHDVDLTGVDAHALLCRPSLMPFEDLATASGLRIHEIESGHDVMVLEPEAVVALLDDLVSRPRPPRASAAAPSRRST